MTEALYMGEKLKIELDCIELQERWKKIKNGDAVYNKNLEGNYMLKK